MKLDQTFIAIRERNALEILDLGLQLVRQHYAKLFWLLFWGALPWIIIDWILVRDLLDLGYLGESRFPFFWLMLMLVISQAQVGTTMVTYYLGQTMFIEEMSVKKIVRETFWKGGYFWWLHGGLRLIGPILGIALLGWAGGWSEFSGYNGLLVVLVIVAVVVRACRPFVTEILLLEKTPISGKDQQRVNFSRRSQNLHSNASGELMNRFLIGCFFLPLLLFAIYSALNLFDDAVALQSSFEFPLKSLYFTIALWLTAGFAAVVRFLSYIDVRIRQEGWAVELKMRAEGMRLAGEDF